MTVGLCQGRKSTALRTLVVSYFRRCTLFLYKHCFLFIRQQKLWEKDCYGNRFSGTLL